MLRVQRYADDITKIIVSTKVYGKDVGLSDKYLKLNVEFNIKNYIDMTMERRGFTKEELVLLISEYEEYMDKRWVNIYFEEDK